MDELVVRRLNKPDLKISGRLIGEISAHEDALAEGDTWTQLKLFETHEGWVAIRLRQGRNLEQPIGEISKIKRPIVMSDPNGIIGLDGDVPNEEIAVRSMRNDVLAFFEWSWLSKRFADDLGWDMVEELDY